MLQPRTATSNAAESPILILSDRAQFISEVRLLIGGTEAMASLMAMSPSHALAILETSKAGCAIVDHEMADGAGLKAVAKLRNELEWPERALPIILVTHQPSLQTIRTAIELGIDEVLATPITAETITGRLRAVRTRARPFVITSRYAGPCRRRRASEHLLSHGLRRREDIHGGRSTRLSREVNNHLLAYHAAQQMRDLLTPPHSAAGGEAVTSAASRLFERSLTLRDARIESLARLAYVLASNPEDRSRDLVLMVSTLEDLLMLLNRRLDHAARRIEASFNQDHARPGQLDSR